MSDTPSTQRTDPIAYVAHYFPSLHQTFVYREVQGMEGLGWTIHPFSIRRPTKGISQEAEPLAARTHYVVPIPWLRFIGRQLRLFLTRPLRYLGLLFWIVTRPGESLRSRIHGLTHFFGGIHVAGELQRAGVRHVHAHFGMNPTTLAMVAAGYLDIPFSMTIHARDLFVDTALLPAKIARAKFVVTISEYNRKILEDLAASPEVARKIHVIHCGIDPQRFAPEPESRAKPDATPEAPRFVAVGRLVPKKGYRYLVEAAKILKDRDIRFEVTIVGGGPDQELLERRIAELDVGDRVRLEGPLPQERILPLLQRADGFVLPCVRAEDGDQDGIPVSLMEALACEVPCVSTDLSGIPELIEPGKNGFLVPEKDPAALAEALETLSKDPELRRRLGRAGRSKIEESFSLDVEVRDLDRLIRG